MRICKYLLPVALLFCLAGCFDINEQIEIKPNGSGQLSVNTDMSQLLDLMQSYVGKEEMDKQMPNRKMDTTLQMKDLVDTSTSLSAENKELVRKGWIHMKLNMDEKIFKADTHFPFTSIGNLQKLYNSMNDGTINTNSLLKGMSTGAPDTSSGSAQMPDMNQFNGVYDFICKDGMISRKLNAEKWKAVQANPQFSQMKDAGSMGIEIPYTLTIIVPRPVKKIDNSLAVLSPDKKTVTLKYNFTEVLEHPEKFEYTLVY